MKELETTDSMRQIRIFQSEQRTPPSPRQAGVRRHRRKVKVVGAVVLKTCLGVERVVGKIGPWFHLWCVC